MVLPHGVLFRGGAEGKIRRGIVEADLFEAVIGLAPNLFYGGQHPGVHLRPEQEQASRATREGAVRGCEPGGLLPSRQGAELSRA